MVMELLLASNNDHKRLEFNRLFPGVTIRTPREMGVDFDFPENGDTFLANAHGKAMALFLSARTPVLADDSGLCVPALGGEPGVYSNRYGVRAGAPPLEAPVRNAYLLRKMAEMKDRAAFFVCCLVLVLGESRFLVAQETVEGVITDAPRGRNGFGYDPLFLVPSHGCTMAELTDAEKDFVSHRGRAARRIRALLGADESRKESAAV
jgi:XTP/dITP diphosphohydrolase